MASGAKGKAVKVKKPMRPMSSYTLYVKEQMRSIAGLNKQNIVQHLKNVAARWKNVTPQYRQDLDQRAAADRQRYFREMAEHNKMTLKRPANGYSFFIGDYARRNGARFRSYTQAMVEGARMWKGMTIEQKSYWMRKGLASSQAYQEKKMRFAANNITPNPPKKRRQATPHRRRAAKKRAAVRKASG